MQHSPTGQTNGRTLARALSMLACVVAFGCGATKPQVTSRETPPREAPGYRDTKATGFRAPDDGVVPLCMHFQGGAKAAAENIMRDSQLSALQLIDEQFGDMPNVLITNCEASICQCLGRLHHGRQRGRVHDGHHRVERRDLGQRPIILVLERERLRHGHRLADARRLDQHHCYPCA
jgi:hypothetical protein